MKRLVAFLLVCGLAGCGEKIAEKAVEKAIEKEIGGEATVNIGEESLTVKGEDGTMTLTSGKAARVPENFPADVHVYDGATVLNALASNEGFHLTLQSQDSPEKIVAAYKEKMTGQNWTQEMSMDMGVQKMLSFKKDSRSASVIVAADGEKTRVTIGVQM